MKHLYERALRPLLFGVDPETAHHTAIAALQIASRFDPALTLLQKPTARGRPAKVFGIEFPNRVGLAAGFDKNGVALPAWAALGFGFAEIGTVTARAQPGNPKPRIFRYPEERALINRLGFNNDGAETIAARLARLRASGRWPRIPIGINLGKSKVTPMEDAAEDYAFSFRALREFADYVVLNVSSPNTLGLRSLQEPALLAGLFAKINEENRTPVKPLLVKISPDLSDSELAGIVEVCAAHGIAGIVATNTTLDHSAIQEVRDQAGGLSGAPLRARATEFIRALRAHSALPIIGVGGIMNENDAREKIAAGAALLQLYTGFVYGGPALLRRIVTAL